MQYHQMLKQNKLAALQNNHIIDPAHQKHRRLRKGAAKLLVNQDGFSHEEARFNASLPLHLLDHAGALEAMPILGKGEPGGSRASQPELKRSSDDQG